MALERVRQSSLPEALSEVLSDFADLFRKELKLARVELSSNMSARIRGLIWLGLAGVLALAAFALILGALVAWITTFEIMHVAFMIVAAGVAVLAAIAYLAGRTEAKAELKPRRTINQVRQDIATAKEQLT
jgi:uncharacterized membrane protein YqjE